MLVRRSASRLLLSRSLLARPATAPRWLSSSPSSSAPSSSSAASAPPAQPGYYGETLPDAPPPPRFWSDNVATVPEPAGFRQRARVAAVRPMPFLSFQQPTYERFVNMVMIDGKKQTARRVLWDAFARIREKGHDPQAVFTGALENALPMMEMRTPKTGGAGMVPFPLAPKRAEGIAMKWLVSAARKRNSSSSMDARLANELMQAYQNKGSAVGRRETVHKMALANQASAHFRWRGSNVPGSVDLDSRKQYRPVGRRSLRRFQGAFSKRREPPP